MRTVYVDVLFVVNMLTDLILLLCAGQLLHLRTKPVRLLLASGLGGFFGLAALLPVIPFPLNIALDVTAAALLILAAFGKADLKSFCIRTLVLFSASFSFSGIMLFVCAAFRPKGVEVCNDVVYFNISPPLLIILTLLCYYTLRLLKKFTGGTVGKRVCAVTLRRAGKEVSFRALVDTGCQVREPFSGEYVIIAEKSCLSGFSFPELSKRVIPFTGMGGEGILEGVRAEQIMIDGREISDRVYIGMCDGVMRGEVRAIVPFEIIKNLNVR